VEDDEIALGTSTERTSAGAQKGSAGLISYLVERKRYALIGLGRVACATEIPPPLFVYWKHIAALALGAVTMISAKATVTIKWRFMCASLQSVGS